MPMTPRPATPKTNVTMMPRPVVVHDARWLNPVPTVEREGFALVRQRSRLENFYDEDQVRRVYYPECERLLSDLTGAPRVVVFDHIVRNAARTNEKGIKIPATAVHNDNTASSGPQRLHDLLPKEAVELLRNHFAIINVWRSLRGPVLDSPLGVCDARSIAPGDLVPNARIYPDRRGEIQAVSLTRRIAGTISPRCSPKKRFCLSALTPPTMVARASPPTALSSTRRLFSIRRLAKASRPVRWSCSRKRNRRMILRLKKVGSGSSSRIDHAELSRLVVL
jgi:hypothetical protein